MSLAASRQHQAAKWAHRAEAVEETAQGSLITRHVLWKQLLLQHISHGVLDPT
jgi:hypothetical protein